MELLVYKEYPRTCSGVCLRLAAKPEVQSNKHTQIPGNLLSK